MTSLGQGSIVDSADASALTAALDEAFSYRGDVAIVRHDGSRIEGYIFDRRTGATLSGSSVRLLTATSDDRVAVRYDEIASLEFSGRDTAAGKSWENWLRRYAQKKRDGQAASIEPDAGD